MPSMKTLSKYKFLIIIFISLLPTCLQAQEDHIYIRDIKIVDAFTEEPLEKAHVSVMEKDSCTVLVDSLEPRFISSGGQREYLGFHGNIPRREDIVIRIECKGYPTEYHAWRIPTMTNKKPTTVAYYPEGIYLWQEREQSLGEASVTASRILMVMKGDTIEYNAAAFRMHEGSMLDDLVRALPGATIDDEGHIYVNGEFVKNLLVNGRDFFNGDPKIALRNLPAYSVNKVKVYRYSDKRKYMGKDETLSEEEKRKDPLVMDVALKREYAQGWISNYEVGGGSTLKSPMDGKWMGRMFALRYTNHSSLGIYAAANNTNDGATPSTKGEWSKKNVFDGDKKTYLAGVQLALNPKESPLEFNTSLKAQREETLFKVQELGETFYDKIRTYRDDASENNSTSFDLQWNARLHKTFEKGFGNLSTSAYYKHYKAKEDERTVNQQSKNLSALDTLYTRQLLNNRHETSWGTNISLYRWIYKSYYDSFTYGASFSYNKRDLDNVKNEKLFYMQQEDDNRTTQRHFGLPSYDYNYCFYLSFEKGLKKGLFLAHPYLHMEYQQKFNSGHQELTYVENDWLTPSASAVVWAVDKLNSYHTTRMDRKGHIDAALKLAYSTIWSLSLGAEFNAHMRRITDWRADKRQEKKPTDFLVDPYTRLTWTKNKRYIVLEGTISNNLPDLTLLLDVADSGDPLYVTEGNSQLKASRKYDVRAYCGYKEESDFMRRVELSGGYSEWENNISYAQFYNNTNGVTAIRPMNINGAWQAWAKGEYSRLMGKAKSWNFSNTFNFSYTHSLDYMSDYSQEIPPKSAVNNFNLSNNFRLDYRIKEARIGARADFNWTQQKSEQHRFDRNSFTQFNYGITLSTPLLWNIHFATDLMAYYRRGYRETSMNTTDWVWNAELSCPVGQRKQWIIKAIGFDLLHQISSIRRVVTAQGWTETRYNTKPAYAMLTVTYRLDVKPKKMFEKRK